MTQRICGTNAAQLECRTAESADCDRRALQAFFATPRRDDHLFELVSAWLDLRGSGDRSAGRARCHIEHRRRRLRAFVRFDLRAREGRASPNRNPALVHELVLEVRAREQPLERSTHRQRSAHRGRSQSFDDVGIKDDFHAARRSKPIQCLRKGLSLQRELDGLATRLASEVCRMHLGRDQHAKCSRLRCTD